MYDGIKELVTNNKPKKVVKSCVDLSIVLENEVPVYQRARRLAAQEKEVVNQQIDESLQQEIVRESKSNFASPIVLVKKKDGSNRMCVDYRKLNAKTVKDRYPLPIIEDVLESLYAAKVFTTLDLRNGFFHVDMSEESIKYTSFIVPDGQYEFRKVPFGLCNAPSVFQRYVNKLFEQLIRENVVVVYMDDVIVPSKSEFKNEVLRECLESLVKMDYK